MNKIKTLASPSGITRLLQFVLIFAILGLFYFPLRSQSTLPNAPLMDDSFMYFKIAQNMACGKGISDDGVNLTNGFQPAYGFLIAPAFLLCDGNLLLPIRLVYMINIGLLLLTGYLVARIGTITLFASEKTLLAQLVFWMTWIVYISTSDIQTVHLNGLETGMALCMYCLLWYYFIQTGLSTFRQNIVFGLLLGCAILTRIDVGLFALSYAIFKISRSYRHNQLRQAIGQVALIAIVTLIVTLPWWIYNLVVFHDIMPSSGQAQSTMLNGGQHPFFESTIFSRSVAIVRGLVRNIFPYNTLWLGIKSHLDIATRLVVIVPIALVSRLTSRYLDVQIPASGQQKRQRAYQFGSILLMTVILLSIYYGFYSEATWFYSRYLAPLILVIYVLIIPRFMIVVLHNLKPAITLIGLGLHILYPLLLIVVYILGRDTGYGGNFQSQVDLINQYVPADEWVASVESGYASYFRGNVSNLDGKTNAEVVHALDTGNIFPYLDTHTTINWIIVFNLNERFAPQYDAMNWVEIDRSSNNRWSLYHRQEQ